MTLRRASVVATPGGLSQTLDLAHGVLSALLYKGRPPQAGIPPSSTFSRSSLGAPGWDQTSFLPLLQEPAAVKIPAEMEVELEGREEEEDPPSEAEGPAQTPAPKRARLTNGTAASEESESGGTDSGQENAGQDAGEARLLRSGTYGDRTESKAYGSVTHKCEVKEVFLFAYPNFPPPPFSWLSPGSGVVRLGKEHPSPHPLRNFVRLHRVLLLGAFFLEW